MPLFDVNLMDGIARASKKFPDRSVDIAQSFKYNQLISKQEVIKHIPKSSNVCVLGGWYGIGFMLMRHDTATQYTCIDIDPVCKQIGEAVGCPQFQFHTADALTYDVNSHDVIVNCSTEHMDKDSLKKSFQSIDFKKTCIFQNNNNYFVDDHINCFPSLGQFEEYLGDYFSIHYSTATVMDNGTERYTIVCKKM